MPAVSNISIEKVKERFQLSTIVDQTKIMLFVPFNKNIFILVDVRCPKHRGVIVYGPKFFFGKYLKLFGFHIVAKCTGYWNTAENR